MDVGIFAVVSVKAPNQWRRTHCAVVLRGQESACAEVSCAWMCYRGSWRLRSATKSMRRTDTLRCGVDAHFCCRDDSSDRRDMKISQGRAVAANGMREPRPAAFSCLLYTSPSPRDATLSRMPSSA